MKTSNARVEYYSWLGILLLAIFAALGAWLWELQKGLAVTGMRDVVSWGLYIITFTYFVKLSAGGLIVASSAEVFGISSLKPLSKLGVLVAATCVLMAAASIIPDLGRPERILNLALHPNWSSPMMWDITVITLYLIFALVELWLMVRRKQTPMTKKVLRVLAFVALPSAFALHSITSWIFGLQISRTFWNTALMAPLFVVSAIACGTALLTIIVYLLSRFDKLPVQEKTWRHLTVLMASALALDLFFVFADYVTVIWGNVPANIKTLNFILPGGRFQWLFYLEWLIGGAIPFILLVVPKFRRKGVSALAALLILVGVYAYQTELVVVGLVNPLLQLPPGISLGTSSAGDSAFQLTGQYSPTWVEYTIILGLVAAIALVITLGYRWLIRDSATNLEQEVINVDNTLKGAQM